AVPSHFTVFAGEREKVRAALQALDVKTSVYWPRGPLIDLDGQEDTRYIYDHVLSLPCDQRFSTEDMKFIAAALNSCR
ncbi:MAG: DegT/DnrJ/EryC1/StrS aminotransferase, partial [Pyramidobacter sp.]|nr:DegT/DnrJ/EryC1/StrS aminotransferase [Pyramidobacter sp.]